MSESLGLGRIITTPQHRDAVHIAVAPCVASKSLAPGERVGFTGIDGKTVGPTTEPFGIVDPFLDGGVRKGEEFWVYLFPGSITSLRHDWTHKSFPESQSPAKPAECPLSAEDAAKQSARIWIEAFAGNLGYTFERLMEHANDFVAYEEYARDDTESYKGFDFEEFWKHYEVLTGNTPKYKEAFFTCSC